MSGALGAVERKGGAGELEGHGRAVGGRDMVRALEELSPVRVAVGLDGPVVRVAKGGVGVVDSEVHPSSGRERGVTRVAGLGERLRLGDKREARAGRRASDRSSSFKLHW